MPCKTPEEQRAYQRAWLQKRRAEYLVGQSCVDCGSDENLELDHLDRSEKVSHRIWSWSRPRLEAELAKCVWRCVDCHRKRHAEERMRHGVSRYRAGCRCEVCREAKRESNRKYRKRPGPESHRGLRLCRPSHSSSATGPEEGDRNEQEAA